MKKVKLKDAIFDDKIYPTAKRILVIIFIITLFLFRINDVYTEFSLTIVLIATAISIIYLISKIFFYNTKRNIMDILLLILFILLFFWGFMTYTNL